MLSRAMKFGRVCRPSILLRQPQHGGVAGHSIAPVASSHQFGAYLQSRRAMSTDAMKEQVLSGASLHPHYEAVASSIPLTNSPSDLVLQLIENTHLGMQIPYWESIVILTIGLRVLLLPLGIKTAQSAARMAAVRPLLTKVTDAMKRDPNANSAARKKQYSEQSKALLLQYQVNPFVSMAMPFVQLPVFMSCFFALQKIGDYYPAVESGGFLWFTDLAAADSTMILPILNAVSFLLMIEIGSDGMAANDAGKFKWVMRGLAVVMTPVTMTMPCGMFVYWTTNNALSVTQTLVLKLPYIRKRFGMPDPPKDSSSSLSNTLEKNPIAQAVEELKREFNEGDPLRAQIVDGSSMSSKSMPLVKNMGPAPTTFARPPKSTK